MNLLIKIQNGEPVDHPIAEENLRVFYPDLDIENPPDGYAKFIRKPYPILNEFEKIESIEYVPDENYWPSNFPVYTDKFNIVSLSEDEIIGMTFNQIRLANEKMKENMNAPYSAPDDGNLYIWSTSSNAWVIMPDNFNEVVTEYTQKINELGLAGLRPDELENIDKDLKLQLKQITDKINIS